MTSASSTPVARDVVLLGGGHSHALALRMLGMRPWPGVQVTLVSDVSHAPYSGMVPGHLAGIYSWEETHIDLRRLCSWASVRFIRARVIGLDLPAGRALLENRPSLAFDTISINIGSTPALVGIPGAAEYATPAKPVPQFLQIWESLRETSARRPVRIVIAGAGAGGVEVALAMKSRLGTRAEVTLVHQGTSILPTHAAGVRQRLQNALHHAGITVTTGQSVAAVQADGVLLQDGRRLEADATFWTTQASAPEWMRASGMEVDPDGFAVVDDTLRSVSHPNIFAAGDCATIRHAARPKSGVFAVRAARPLFANLERHLAGSPLHHWRPQGRFLSLIGTGNQRAVVSRGAWVAEGAWAWRWKDRIDRAFMRKFSDLPPMDERLTRPTKRSARIPPTELERRATMRCLGCAGKVGSPILHKVLQRLRVSHRPALSPPAHRQDILSSLDSPDDAAVFQPPPGQSVVQTTDHLSALVTDPFLFGRIAAIHSLSDLVAMGATPHSALVTALVPFAADAVTEELLTQLLSGIATELQQHDAFLLGGHTAEAPTLALSLACTGLAPHQHLWRKNGLHPGDALILTKPLGTGTLFAAAMRLAAEARWIDAAIDSMLVSNQAAAHTARSLGATAATDITGFGLIGHLLEMLHASHTSAEIHLNSLPTLPGATFCASHGFLSSLHATNSLAFNSLHTPPSLHSHPNFPLLADPQTSGGLLLAIPSPLAPALLQALQAGDTPHAAVIGTVRECGGKTPTVTFDEPS